MLPHVPTYSFTIMSNTQSLSYSQWISSFCSSRLPSTFPESEPRAEAGGPFLRPPFLTTKPQTRSQFKLSLVVLTHFPPYIPKHNMRYYLCDALAIQVQAGEIDQANLTRGIGTVSPSSCSNPIIYHDSFPWCTQHLTLNERGQRRLVNYGLGRRDIVTTKHVKV